MNLFTWNLLLALLWAATTESFSLANLVIGFVLGFGVLLLVQGVLGSSKYFRDALDILVLIWFFCRELLLANLRMAYYTLSPLDRMRPGVVAVPLAEMSEDELTVLANLLTLTPGTLSLDVSDDHRTLFVHVMWMDDPERIRREIKEGFESRVLRALR